MSAVLYGQVILAAQGAWTAVLLWWMGAARLHAPSDLVLHTGLDAFVADPASPLAALARGVTPFHVVWLAFLTAVMVRGTGVPWWRGALAACTLWAIATGLGVARAAFG